MNRFAYTGICSEDQTALKSFVREFDYSKHGMSLQEILTENRLASVPRASWEDAYAEEFYVDAQNVIARLTSVNEAPSDEFMVEFGAGAIVGFIQSVSLPFHGYEIRLHCGVKPTNRKRH